MHNDYGNHALGSYDVDLDDDHPDHHDNSDKAYTEHRSVSSLAEGLLPTSHLCQPVFACFYLLFFRFFSLFCSFPFVDFFREFITRKKLHIGIVQTTILLTEIASFHRFVCLLKILFTGWVS